MYQIGEFAKKCGTNPKTLRYYDKIGILKPDVIKEDSKYRFYSDDALQKFQQIKELQAHGFSIKEIQNLDEKIVDEKIKALQTTNKDYYNKINFLSILKNRMVNSDDLEVMQMKEKILEDEKKWNKLHKFDLTGIWWYEGESDKFTNIANKTVKPGEFQEKFKKLCFGEEETTTYVCDFNSIYNVSNNQFKTKDGTFGFFQIDGQYLVVYKLPKSKGGESLVETYKKLMHGESITDSTDTHFILFRHSSIRTNFTKKQLKVLIEDEEKQSKERVRIAFEVEYEKNNFSLYGKYYTLEENGKRTEGFMLHEDMKNFLEFLRKNQDSLDWLANLEQDKSQGIDFSYAISATFDDKKYSFTMYNGLPSTKIKSVKAVLSQMFYSAASFFKTIQKV